MNSNPTLPWYKQFWPWFLIIVPLTSMILSFTMMHLAFTNEDSMVIDDYYKEGKGINVKLKALQTAQTMGIKSQVSIDQDKIELTFLSTEADTGEALMLDFFHATQEHKDFTVNLFRDAKGIYRAQHTQQITGKWRVSLHPFNNQWKLQTTILLPEQSIFELTP